MKYRNAFNINRIVLVYNAVQVIFSLFIVIQVLLFFITNLNYFIGFKLLITNLTNILTKTIWSNMHDILIKFFEGIFEYLAMQDSYQVFNL